MVAMSVFVENKYSGFVWMQPEQAIAIDLILEAWNWETRAHGWRSACGGFRSASAELLLRDAVCLEEQAKQMRKHAADVVEGDLEPIRQFFAVVGLSECVLDVA